MGLIHFMTNKDLISASHFQIGGGDSNLKCWAALQLIMATCFGDEVEHFTLNRILHSVH